MAFDDSSDLNEFETPEPSETPPPETGNRTFIAVSDGFRRHHAADACMYYPLWDGLSAVCE
jgi:hypothetical protein